MIVNKVWTLFLVSAALLSAAPAAGPERKFGGYALVMGKDKSAAVHGPDRSLLVSLDDVYRRHYHPFEVHGDEVFWIRREGKPSDEDWNDQLWAIDVKTGDKEELLRGKGIDFRASPRRGAVIFVRDEELLLLNRKTGKTRTLCPKGEGGRDDGFTLLGWSSDGAGFWFGVGARDSWSRLGLYRGGKIRWFSYAGGSEDEAMNFDRGLLVVSDAPFGYDPEIEKEFEKSRAEARLTAIDVFSGRKAVVARGPAQRFKPSWSGGALEYFIGKEKKRIAASDILPRLK